MHHQVTAKTEWSIMASTEPASKHRRPSTRINTLSQQSETCAVPNAFPKRRNSSRAIACKVERDALLSALCASVPRSLEVVHELLAEMGAKRSGKI